MKVLVLGSGGREHALVWKLRQSPRISKLFCAPGSGGIATDADVEALLRRTMKKRGISFKAALNEAIREGLSGASPRRARAFTLKTYRMGFRPEVALDKAMLTVGRRLSVDARAENFGNDQDANRLLTREYRKGFVVPARF